MILAEIPSDFPSAHTGIPDGGSILSLMTDAPRSGADPTQPVPQSPAPHVPPPWPSLHPSEPIPPSPTSRRRNAPAALALVGVVALLAGAAGAAAGVAVRDGSSGSSSSATRSPRGSVDGSSSNSFQAPTDASGSSIDLGQVATAASPAVVNIATTLSNGEQAAGSGLVLTPKGRILTNNHVISGATDIEVEIGVTGDTYSADVVGYDTADDVAVIQLDDASGLQTIKTAPAASVEEQDLVIAIGNALGRFGTPSVVSGTVTALHQDITAGDGLDQESLQDMIRVEASIQPGDSGGALLDDTGRVIGMNTAADVGGSQFGFSSGTTGFAIPIDRALTIADEILGGDSSNGAHIGKRALLGVVLTDGGQGSSATVDDVSNDSPAADAGIGSGDTITAVDGHSVRSADGLRTILDRYHPGDDVSVRWTDAGGDDHQATVSLAEGPPA
jgi:S1-C subfamily serine protease